EAAHPLPFAVIGMVGKDRGGAKQLLGEHRANEQVWPGRQPEREQKIRAAALFLAMAVSATDQEACLALAGVAPYLELPGELGRSQRLPAFIEDDLNIVRSQRRQIA